MHLIPTTPLQTTPLAKLKIAAPGSVEVCDAKSRVYFTGHGEVEFAVGGALGKHTVNYLDENGKTVKTSEFFVDAKTEVKDDKGIFSELINMLEYTMRWCFAKDGSGVGKTPYKGKDYYSAVVWILDHYHTCKGFQYFSPHTNGLVDLLKLIQREDGMIWSFLYPNDYGQYFRSAYERPYGYAKEIEPGGYVAGRQPVENHCEYNYVECAHLVWKSSGDDMWMKDILQSCKRALDYTKNSNVRWSDKYQLLKRGYTIDSWDFQPQDQYLPEFALGREMQIDPDRTKFTIFYGDNTGYAMACDKLAEMLEYAGQMPDAEEYRSRASDIRRRLDALAWNGRFYQHRIEEDETVKRDLGADEATQISLSNAYTLNRNCTQEQGAAIIKSYMGIRDNLPSGSPGEFYAIYPPFEKPVFGSGDNHKWQYMNGGVHGHVAGELARGAFTHGFEKYGAEILQWANDIAKKSSGMLRFAYTGGYEPAPPPQKFTTVDISQHTNMSLSCEGETPWMFDGLKNEIPTFPLGRFEHDNVPYDVAGVAAISTLHNLPKQMCVPLDAPQQVGSIYLLHASNHCTDSALVAMVVFEYTDGTRATRAIKYDENVANYCFANLKKERAGVAWKGENHQFFGVAVLWAEIINPEPDKITKCISFEAGPDGACYAVLGLTLADRQAYIKPPLESSGGPDNWSAGLCMAALIEGLAGITESHQSTMFDHAQIAPRWLAADTKTVSVTARYAASDGYVAYEYSHNQEKKCITLTATGSGDMADFSVLLPQGATGVASVTAGASIPFTTQKVEDSTYVNFQLAINAPVCIELCYR